MKSILITGINGFVGSNFTKKWSNNHTLHGIDIRQPNVEGVVKTFSWDELKKCSQGRCYNTGAMKMR